MKQRNLTGNVSDSHKTHLCQAVEQSLLHRPLYSGYVQYAIPTRDKVAPVAQTRINRILRVLLFHFCSDWWELGDFSDLLHGAGSGIP